MSRIFERVESPLFLGNKRYVHHQTDILLDDPQDVICYLLKMLFITYSCHHEGVAARRTVLIPPGQNESVNNVA